MSTTENIPNAILRSRNKIPIIGMGTTYLVVDYDQVYVKQAILEAIEQGYRHFDTSPNYMSESLIGEAIAESLKRHVIYSRQEIFVTSKLWLTDAHPDLVLPALRTSLRNSQLDYVDLYLIHWPISAKPGSHPIKPEDLLPMDIESVWRAMEDCQRLGLTKSIGVSNFTCKKLKYLLTFARIPPCVNQVEMNPVWQQKQLREFCSSNGILVIAYAPLGAKGAHWGTNQVMDCKLLKEIALTRGKTVAQVCLRWIYEQGAGMVVKSFNKERMKKNLGIFDWELSDEDYLKINKIQQQRGMPKSRFVSENGPYKSLEELWDGMVCMAGFGIDYKEEPTKGMSLGKMLEESVIVLNGSFVDSFPWLGRIIDQLSGWNDRLEKCFSGLDAYIEMVIHEHYNCTNTEINEHDKNFLQSMLELSSKHDASDYRLTMEDVKALIMDVLIGGVDTTAVTIVWAMSEIARNTRIKKKLQNEIRICMGRKKESHELDLTKTTYLKQVVKETLRLHPPAPLLIPHESLSHTQVSGYDIFPGTTVLINGWGIGRDPSTWGENAAEFYPERFEEVDVNYGGVNFDFIPFGGGRRSCPAMSSAPTVVESVIANLLYWFDWEVPVMIKNEELNMEEEGSLLVRRKLPLYLVPTKHKWED